MFNTGEYMYWCFNGEILIADAYGMHMSFPDNIHDMYGIYKDNFNQYLHKGNFENVRGIVLDKTIPHFECYNEKIFQLSTVPIVS